MHEIKIRFKTTLILRHTAVLTSSSAYELARTVKAADVGCDRTKQTEGWRRFWPLIHSDLSIIGEDLRRVAEAEAIFLFGYVYLWANQ